MNGKNKRIIISGGGTGGHIFPAISVAQVIREMVPDSVILFVGAEGRMEMEKVPQAGFDIVGLPIAGFQRKNVFKNFRLPWLLWKSIRRAHQILDNFRPHAALGTGGYASGPLLWAAGKKKIPYIIQEQNSYPGITNRLLARKATKICTGYPDMTAYFPADKTVFTGNPVRRELEQVEKFKEEAYSFFGFCSEKPVLLVLGGSQGARKINEAVVQQLPRWKTSGIQLIWQTGTSFLEKARQVIQNHGFDTDRRIYVTDFLQHMHYAYALADLVISRSGASTVSELCLCGKPSILIPSPYVAEDHQTKNAQAMVSLGAAIHIPEPDIENKLHMVVEDLLNNPEKRKTFSQKALALAKPDAARTIAQNLLALIT